MALDYMPSSSASQFMSPAGDSIVNVVENFRWTNTPKSARREVPTVVLTEYQQQAGALVASLLYFSRIVGNGVSITDLYTSPKDTSDVYKYKYVAEPTGFVYNFPYFSQKVTSRSTDFAYEDNKHPFGALIEFGTNTSLLAKFSGSHGGGGLTGLIGRANAWGGALKGVVDAALPGKLTLDNPREWNKTDEGSYPFTFDLLNTGTTEEVSDNYKLCFLLAYQQSSFRRTFCITDPVCIYSVLSPNFSLPAAYIDQLDIKNLGNTRQMSLNGKTRIIPEAYRITISLQSLFAPSRNILQKLSINQGVQAIGAINGAAMDALQKTLSDTLRGNEYTAPNFTPAELQGLQQSPLINDLVQDIIKRNTTLSAQQRATPTTP